MGEEILRGNQRGGFGVGDDVADFAIAVKNVNGDEDDAEAGGGEVEVDELEAVGEEDAEAVSAGEAAVGEKMSHAPSTVIDLAEGIEPVPFKRWFEAAANEGEVEQVGQGHGRARRSPGEDRRRAEAFGDGPEFAIPAWVWP